MMKTVSLAALFAVAASASFAGSLNTTYEAEPEREYVAPVTGSSGIGVPVVVGGLVAAAAVAALVSSDSDSDTVTPEIED
ncbi:hypothetical protein [uncultured Sulfitobacter sp.]|uniref:hypothetical protein n=1 Tax=uncultured Sulfitobacter sp. TaxID=191468 RepID=UPI0026096925|nr:hypothetical protein [uncultured Sulfitobacter sp.]